MKFIWTKVRLDLGKCWDVARRGLLISCAKDLICQSHRHSIFLVARVFNLVSWGNSGSGFGQ